MTTRTRQIGSLLGLIAALSLSSSPAFAHVGDHAHGSFFAGFIHPIGGLDHLAAIVAVGLWAAMVGGQRVWIWPAAFVSVMIVGGVLGRAGVDVPMVEPMIAGSVVLLGLGIAAPARAPVVIGAVVIAALGIFHGYAHGAEAPAGDWLGYAAGFVIATALLHAIGIGAGQFLKSDTGLNTARVVGSATAVLGLVLLIQ